MDDVYKIQAKKVTIEKKLTIKNKIASYTFYKLSNARAIAKKYLCNVCETPDNLEDDFKTIYIDWFFDNRSMGTRHILNYLDDFLSETIDQGKRHAENPDSVRRVSRDFEKFFRSRLLSYLKKDLRVIIPNNRLQSLMDTFDKGKLLGYWGKPTPVDQDLRGKTKHAEYEQFRSVQNQVKRGLVQMSISSYRSSLEKILQDWKNEKQQGSYYQLLEDYKMGRSDKYPLANITKEHLHRVLHGARVSYDDRKLFLLMNKMISYLYIAENTGMRGRHVLNLAMSDMAIDSSYGLVINYVSKKGQEPEMKYTGIAWNKDFVRNCSITPICMFLLMATQYKYPFRFDTVQSTKQTLEQVANESAKRTRATLSATIQIFANKGLGMKKLHLFRYHLNNMFADDHEDVDISEKKQFLGWSQSRDVSMNNYSEILSHLKRIKPSYKLAGRDSKNDPCDVAYSLLEHIPNDQFKNVQESMIPFAKVAYLGICLGNQTIHQQSREWFVQSIQLKRDMKEQLRTLYKERLKSSSSTTDVNKRNRELEKRNRELEAQIAEMQLSKRLKSSSSSSSSPIEIIHNGYVNISPNLEQTPELCWAFIRDVLLKHHPRQSKWIISFKDSERKGHLFKWVIILGTLYKRNQLPERKKDTQSWFTLVKQNKDVQTTSFEHFNQQISLIL